MGALVLGYTLKLYHPKIPRICFITPDVNDTWISLLNTFWKTIIVDPLTPYKNVRISWTKLHSWDLTDYQTVVYLDADTFLLGPVDELFSEKELSCVSDLSRPEICNTGVMVLEPKKNMITSFEAAIIPGKTLTDIGDQTFLNSYFGMFRPLPYIYNLMSQLNSPLSSLPMKPRVIHITGVKPWNAESGGDVWRMWWERWNDACMLIECPDRHQN